MTSAKTRFPNKFTFTGSGVRTPIYLNVNMTVAWKDRGGYSQTMLIVKEKRHFLILFVVPTFCKGRRRLIWNWREIDKKCSGHHGKWNVRKWANNTPEYYKEWHLEREAGVCVKMKNRGWCLTFTECLLWARHGFKHFRCIISFNLSPWVSSFYRRRNWGSELHNGQFLCYSGIFYGMIEVALYFPVYYYYY